MIHRVKTPVYRFDLYGRYKILWTDDDNFWQCYLELVYKSKYQIWCESNVPCAQDPSYRFDLYGWYRNLWTDDDNFWQCYLELLHKPKYQIWCESDVLCAQETSYKNNLYGRYRTLYTDDDYFCGIIQSQYTSLSIKFGRNRTFHALKTAVY